MSLAAFHLLTLGALTVWFLGDVLLLIFAAILFAILLTAAANSFAVLVPLGHGFRVVAVAFFILAIFVGFLATSGALLVQQSGEILEILGQQFRQVRGWVAGMLPANLNVTDDETFRQWLPSASALAGRATSAISGLLGIIGNFIVIVMIGIFLALNPKPYIDGLVRLFPIEKRSRIEGVLEEVGRKLKWWIAGMSINMIVIAAAFWLGLTLIGMPYALALALLAGGLAFIPNLGPLIASVPIMVVGLSQSPMTAIWALGLYLLIQTLESYLLTPLVQKQMVRLYPAFVLSFQLIFTVLFGLLGLAVATPLAAAGQVFVNRFYVEDVLGDEVKDDDSAA